MKDRYLFKAKRVDNGEWVIGNLIYGSDGKIYIVCSADKESLDNENTDLLVTEWYEVFGKTICQCTGLKDKNGKLIWENDIIKCVDENNDMEFTAIVEFGNPNGFYNWGYQLRHIKGDKPNLNILLWVEMEEAGATCEVIGNKFDNPELLESEE